MNNHAWDCLGLKMDEIRIFEIIDIRNKLSTFIKYNEVYTD